MTTDETPQEYKARLRSQLADPDEPDWPGEANRARIALRTACDTLAVSGWALLADSLRREGGIETGPPVPGLRDTHRDQGPEIDYDLFQTINGEKWKP